MSSNPSAKQIVESRIAEWVAPLGYDVVLVEISASGHRKIQIYIDRKAEEASKGAVGIEDCVSVTRALDEPLDALPEVERLFAGHSYDLEVSSPGIDRPLRTEQDFTRFSGKLARIHVFRPLNADEIGNADYLAKNPKQKNFVGTLAGLENRKLLIRLDGGIPTQVTIPLELVSKANLEPVFDFSEERKAK